MSIDDALKAREQLLFTDQSTTLGNLLDGTDSVLCQSNIFSEINP